jgi:hypothetical protein
METRTPKAWMRGWYARGEKPYKEKQANGRWAWPNRFKFKEVTDGRIFDDDVPLYADSSPIEAIELARLRALEAEVVKVWTEDEGSVQIHTPIAWFRVLRLIPSLNEDA